jgi:hypothetical protein
MASFGLERSTRRNARDRRHAGGSTRGKLNAAYRVDELEPRDLAIQWERRDTEYAPMPKDRGELGELADSIRKATRLPIFPFSGNLPVEEAVTWSGSEAVRFLEFAEKVGAPMIYLNEAIVGEDDEDPKRAAHAGETWLVEIAFLLGGEFHVFARAAEWAGIGEEESEEADRGKALEVLTTKKDELVQEFVADFEKRPESAEANRFSIEHNFRGFVASKLPLPPPRPGVLGVGIPHDGSPLDLLVQQIGAEVAMDLNARLNAKEREIVEPLVAECVAWASKSGLTRPTLGDIEVFLDEKRIRVSRSAIRLLCNRVKVALRTARK